MLLVEIPKVFKVKKTFFRTEAIKVLFLVFDENEMLL